MPPDYFMLRHNKSNMVDGRHIENRFPAISQCHVVGLAQARKQNYMLLRHVTKMANFKKSRWQTACICQALSH